MTHTSKINSLIARIMLLFFVLLAPSGIAIAADTLIGTYEISYMYNSMYGGGANGPHNPKGVQYYGNSSTYPIQVSLEPGIYYIILNCPQGARQAIQGIHAMDM